MGTLIEMRQAERDQMHSRVTHLEQIRELPGLAFTMTASGSAAQPNGLSRKPGQRLIDWL